MWGLKSCIRSGARGFDDIVFFVYLLDLGNRQCFDE
jgi:hypothetical protein